MTAINTNVNPSVNKKIKAWGVHLFTASGAIWGLLSILAIVDHQWLTAIIWMAVAAAVDAFDGTLARRFQVKAMIPHFDGTLLDNIIDYQTYAIIPALFLYEAELVPPSLQLLGAAVIMLASGYQFCQSDAKTADHFFKGFPSYWNVVVYYLLLLSLNPWLNLALILLCGLLVFIPIKFIYPSRTLPFRRLSAVLTLVWSAINLIILYQYPHIPRSLIWLSLLYIAYYVGISLFIMRQNRTLALKKL